MIIDRPSVRLDASFYRRGLDVYILDNDGEAQAVSIGMEKTTPMQGLRPVLTLDKSAGQVLMDDLWKAGLRPTEGAGSAGSLAATQAHLGDMRKIVAVKLGVPL
jgi:hypothetical protein